MTWQLGMRGICRCSTPMAGLSTIDSRPSSPLFIPARRRVSVHEPVGAVAIRPSLPRLTSIPHPDLRPMMNPIPDHHDGLAPVAARRSLLKAALTAVTALLLPRAATAGDDLWTTFQTPAAFLAEAFGTPPAPSVLALDAAMQAQIAAVFGRAYPQTQLRYWKANGRSAWILDDIGKQGYQITTSGFVVKEKHIDFARVLIYRESRGEQVAEPSWLKKLVGRMLVGTALDQPVDNISGATLSVKMMQRMAAAALLLDSLAKA